jgi:hypothetical protein
VAGLFVSASHEVYIVDAVLALRGFGIRSRDTAEPFEIFVVVAGFAIGHAHPFLKLAILQGRDER